MSNVAHDLLDVAPALGFLCLGVPYAALLGRLGTFDHVVSWIRHRSGSVPVVLLWTCAAAVTATLNLDTTIVLLTPISIRLARRSGTDPLPIALIPLLLSAFASSFLPVSNLTTLIVTSRIPVAPWEVTARLGPASLTAVLVGWLVHRRSVPPRLVIADVGRDAGRVGLVGSTVVVSTVVGFVVGGAHGIEPWMVLAVADTILVIRTRWIPWREVPVVVAAAVAALVVATSAFGLDGTSWLLGDGPASAGVAAIVGGGSANAINNLPATLVGLGSAPTMSDGAWGWLFGVNAGSLMLPWGALATVLWWRVLRSEDVAVDLPTYLRSVLPVAVPAFLAGITVLVASVALR